MLLSPRSVIYKLRRQGEYPLGLTADLNLEPALRLPGFRSSMDGTPSYRQREEHRFSGAEKVVPIRWNASYQLDYIIVCAFLRTEWRRR
jgi:hypothetical protein